MTKVFGYSILIVGLALASTGPAFTQITDTPAKTPVPVAHFYIQTKAGVMAFATAANGTLTPVPGSPFKVSGQMEDIRGKVLVSVGTTKLHSYRMEANGGIGKQLSEIDTASYGGSECGGTSGQGSIFDHTGKYLYVQLDAFPDSECSSWQSYTLEPDGAMKFLGDIVSNNIVDGIAYGSFIPTVSSNDKFVYGSFPYWGQSSSLTWGYRPYFLAFTTTSSGDLKINESFEHADPPPYEGYTYYPVQVQADPFGHLAVLEVGTSSTGGNIFGGQLASYTIDPSTGAISSTSTGADMPTVLNIDDNAMKMSPSGKLLAVASNPGLEIYHFNGAAPITTFSGWMSFGFNFQFDQLAWDNDNHLYGLSYSAKLLHVLTVTPTNISEAPGSPYSFPSSPYGATGLIVIP